MTYDRGRAHQPPLTAFTSFHYMNLMRNPLATFRRWRIRKHDIRNMPLAANA
jgi:hypothetical protein